MTCGANWGQSVNATRLRWLDLPGYARPYGGQLVIDQLRARGVDVADRGPLDASRTLLVSLYWCEALYDWIRFKARNGIGRKARVVIGGNLATGSPAACAPFASGVYRGDGDEWDGVSDAHLWTADRSAAPALAEQLPRRCIVMETKAVGKASFAIMELSRGCRYRCHYCQYAWMKPYREQSSDYICGQLRTLKGRARFAAADVPQHREYPAIMAAAARAGVRITTQDGALLSVAKSGGDLEKMQRFGVDGMSERLRKAMHKPIGREWLVARIAEYSRRGVRRCLAYNLFGLPGETAADFDEWDATVRAIVDAVERPFTWVNSWNAFLPMPMTPLEKAPSSWGNDHRDPRAMAATRDYAKAKGCQVFDMPQRTSGRTITGRMLAIRGTSASADILATWALRGERYSEQRALRDFAAAEGYELHGAMP